MIVAVWTPYEANAVWVVSNTFLLSFAAKWAGERTKTYTLPDYHGFRRFTDKDDKPLLKDLWKLLNEADIVIAHNGDRFDLKKITARFMVQGFDPPSPIQSFDTLKEVKKVAAFDSHRLDNLGQETGIGRKLAHTGGKLWRACGEGDEKSWGKMARYNAQDVDLLARWYEILKPWAKSHPNVALYSGKFGCPTCGSTRFKRDGFKYNKTRTMQQFKCLECRHYFSGTAA